MFCKFVRPANTIKQQLIVQKKFLTVYLRKLINTSFSYQINNIGWKSALLTSASCVQTSLLKMLGCLWFGFI